MATTPVPPSGKSDGPGRGLAARVSLGRQFRPLASEFLLIAAVAIFLTVFGFVMVLSATSASTDPFDIALKQGIFGAVGIPLMFVLSRFPLTFWKRMAWPILILAVAFQMLIYTPLAIENDGNVGWVDLGVAQAQPAEFLKLATAIWIGFILARKEALLTNWKHLAIPLVPVVILVLASVLGGEDLGTAMIIMLVVFAALFFAGVKLRILIFPLAVAAVAVAVLAITSPNRIQRITSFLDPNCSASDALCYQQEHGLWALANGGLFGVGLGNSTEKYGWLPAKGNDFIFAIIGEELGLIGCFVVLALFAVFTFAAIRIIRRTDDTFVRIVAGAIAIWIVGQALVNIAVVLRLAPPLGVPLPFLSQGGTSLLSVLIAAGVLLSFARTLPADAPAPTPVRVRNPVQRIDTL
ncbi:peptidoglycan glycosyltransferase FtsW [Microbacterium gorillae]|uniref:peptidoglycan glycosyltransferase FtsW n=1 Tax=Microbacterium gorillae TaxID=1231063 RepID=UPI000694981D|nr:putative peptidoglycan glycosyltransferase FtsW [Microbacterium gorillae]